MLHVSFAVIVSFVFLIICLIASVALFESRETHNDFGPKVTSRPDFTLLLVKV